VSNIAPIMRRRFAILAILVSAAALLVAGCGNYTEENVSPAPITVADTAPDRFAADEAEGEGGHGGTTAEEPAATTAADDAAATDEATTTAADDAAAGDEGAADAGDPAEGKNLFASSGCAACHTLADAGAAGVVGPNLDETKPPVARAIDTITNGKGAMPAFKGQLSDEQIANIAAYIASATQG
jgi:mono/diheme cytochrome c family protein